MRKMVRSNNLEVSDSRNQFEPTPLQICLCCGYSLTGLPIAHDCPECGLAYSDKSFAIEVNKEQHPVTLLIGVVAWAGMGYVMFSSAMGRLSSLIGALIATTGVGLNVLHGRFRRRLIVDTNGVHMMVQNRINKSIRWAEISGFQFSRIDGGLLARTHNGKSIRLCRDSKIAKACRKDIESAWHDHYQRTPTRRADMPDR